MQLLRGVQIRRGNKELFHIEKERCESVGRLTLKTEGAEFDLDFPGMLQLNCSLVVAGVTFC